MNTFKANAFKAISVVYLLTLFFSFLDATPSLAQYTSGHALTPRYRQAPSLQGATMGTIGPPGSPSYEATFVTGVNTAGTVRVNNLAMLEALLNIVTNGVEIIMILWEGALFLCAMCGFLPARDGVRRCFWSAGFLAFFLFSGTDLLASILTGALVLLDPNWNRRDKAHVRMWLACFIIKIGLVAPTMVNWLLAAARDANLFS